MARSSLVASTHTWYNAKVLGRGVAVNMFSLCGEDHRFESGRARRVSEGNPASDLSYSLQVSEEANPGENDPESLAKFTQTIRRLWLVFLKIPMKY